MIYFIGIASLGYFLALLAGILALLLPKRKEQIQLIPVSVVICARNEAIALPDTLAAVAAQDYPRELIEYILVDHSSSDQTKAVFEAFAAEDPVRRKVLSIPEDLGELRGKAAPWHAGMEASSHEIVLTTGADCIVPKDWIKLTVAKFDEKTQIVSGSELLHSKENPNSIYNLVQNLDMAFIQGIGYAVARLGLGGSGLSNNFAIRRSAYFAVGGFPQLGFSICEDVLLSQGVLQKYGNRALQYHLDRRTFPVTEPEPPNKLANMKLRWSMGTRRLGLGGLLMIAFNFLSHLGSILAVIFGGEDLRTVGWIGIFGGVVLESLFLILVLIHKGIIQRNVLCLPFFLIYLWIYPNLVAIPVIFRLPVRWKGLWVREPV